MGLVIHRNVMTSKSNLIVFNQLIRQIYIDLNIRMGAACMSAKSSFPQKGKHGMNPELIYISPTKPLSEQGDIKICITMLFFRNDHSQTTAFIAVILPSTWKLDYSFLMIFVTYFCIYIPAFVFNLIKFTRIEQSEKQIYLILRIIIWLMTINFITFLMKITKIRQEKKQTRISNVKTQPSQHSVPMVMPSHIVIPVGEVEASLSEGNSYAFKNNRPNLKQLYDFLKHQVIVVKQKQRIITNKEEVSKFKSINQMHEKITKALCLKSEEAQQLKQYKQNNKIKNICLPKIDRNYSLVNSNKQQQRKPLLHRFPKRMQNINSLSSHKRLRTIDSKQNSPLLSYKYFQRRKGGGPLKGEVLLKQPQIINLHLFKQNPRITNLSLEVAIQVSRQHRRFLSQQS